MVFTLILMENADDEPGFIITPGGHAMAELSACPSVPVKQGMAYHVSKVKSFMQRNNILSLQVCYVHDK